jgi:hypothetical protein
MFGLVFLTTEERKRYEKEMSAQVEWMWRRLALNWRKKNPIWLVPFSTLFRPFPYLWDPVSVFTETREGFFRPFSWDPIFIRI